MKKTYEVHAICKICNKIIRTGEDLVKPGLVGIETINKASKEQCSDLLAVVGNRFHDQCRRSYVDKWYINEGEKLYQSGVETPMNLRSQGAFSFKNKFFFCGHVSIREKQTKNASEVLSKFAEIDITVKDTRGFDAWALDVHGRLAGIT